MAIFGKVWSPLYQPSRRKRGLAHPAQPNRQPDGAVWRCPAASPWFRANYQLL